MRRKVFILEDSQERLDWFFEKLAGFEIHYIDNPQDAINILGEFEFDYIFLDHDLLPNHYNQDTNCNKTTGLCVAEWLGNNLNKSKNASIIIHSMNWNGAKRMQNAMRFRNCDWISYPILQNKLVVNKEGNNSE